MSKSATKSANRNLPALIPQPNGRGALYAGGVPGNKGGGRHPDWLKPRMAAALRAGKAAEVVRDIISGDIYEQIGVDRDGNPIFGVTRNADRLRAIDLAAELADLKPKKDLDVAVTYQATGAERMAALLAALPNALRLLPEAERAKLAAAVQHVAVRE